MHYRTTFRLGNGIDRIMRWVMQARIPAVNLSWILAAIWLFFIVNRVPEAFGLIARAMALKETTNEIATEKKRVPKRHSGFISVAVARQYGPPMQYPKH